MELRRFESQSMLRLSRLYTPIAQRTSSRKYIPKSRYKRKYATKSPMDVSWVKIEERKAAVGGDLFTFNTSVETISDGGVDVCKHHFTSFATLLPAS